jgi:hypothetical protein
MLGLYKLPVIIVKISGSAALNQFARHHATGRVTHNMDDHLISQGVDSDDENDWEEVEFPELQDKAIEITLNAQPKASEDKR